MDGGALISATVSSPLASTRPRASMPENSVTDAEGGTWVLRSTLKTARPPTLDGVPTLATQTLAASATSGPKAIDRGASRPWMPPTLSRTTWAKTSSPVVASRWKTARLLPSSATVMTYWSSGVTATSLTPTRPRTPSAPFTSVWTWTSGWAAPVTRKTDSVFPLLLDT